MCKGYCPRMGAYVRIGSPRYIEWQTIIHEHTTPVDFDRIRMESASDQSPDELPVKVSPPRVVTRIMKQGESLGSVFKAIVAETRVKENSPYGEQISKNELINACEKLRRRQKEMRNFSRRPHSNWVVKVKRRGRHIPVKYKRFVPVLDSIPECDESTAVELTSRKENKRFTNLDVIRYIRSWSPKFLKLVQQIQRHKLKQLEQELQELTDQTTTPVKPVGESVPPVLPELDEENADKTYQVIYTEQLPPEIRTEHEERSTPNEDELKSMASSLGSVFIAASPASEE